jgi:hypothetical protein
MCHADQQWTDALPLVLLGIRMAFKVDLQASVAELVYSELLTPTADSVDPVTVSADRVKPAYILNGTDRRNNSFNTPVDSNPTVALPATPPLPATRTTRTTRSGRLNHFPARFNS